jgi:hypothetical protein
MCVIILTSFELKKDFRCYKAEKGEGNPLYKTISPLILFHDKPAAVNKALV